MRPRPELLAELPRTLVVEVDPSGASAARASFSARFGALLAALNWRLELYLVGATAGGTRDRIDELIAVVGDFLTTNEMVMVRLHPFVVPAAADEGTPRWERYIERSRRFQWQAFERQSEPRMAILPILETDAALANDDLLRVTDELHVRSAKPSAFLTGDTAVARAAAAADGEIRFYISADDGPAARLEQLAISHVFEAVQGRVDRGDDLLAACPRHLVVREADAAGFACFQEWREGHQLGGALAGEELAVALAGFAPPPTQCRECISTSVLAMAANLVANSRRAEGRRVHFELGRALASAGDYVRAARHAARAAELAGDDVERGQALVDQGLSELGAGHLEAAEAALAAAAEVSDDPGMVAYHRGRVQLDWRDYIEALERFEEAMKSTSAEVPRIDLFFHMTVCHVKLEEYPEARGYIDSWREAGGELSTINFYQGLCELGEGALDAARDCFAAAIAAGPERDDRGRVLFYLGFTLKELERFADAIVELERAVSADPDELASHNLLGYCYYKCARHKEAVTCFRRAIAIDPSSGIDHANLASNLRDLGRIDEAVAMYRRALELDPSIDFARDNLVKLAG